MRVVVVVQARTGSSRLPGKVLLPVCGASLLVRQVERIAAASTPTEIVIATTVDGTDDPIVEIGRAAGYRVLRGHPTDCLDRHVVAARAAKADAVVKIPSDCPLIDPAAIDRVIGTFVHAPGAWDFVSNLHPPTWPDGNDVEIMPMAVLETAARQAQRPLEREHTTPFIWDQPERFRVCNVPWETGLDYSESHRFTLDYEEDYQMIRAVYEALWTPARPIFPIADILALLDARPDIRNLNARHLGVTWYRNHPGELKTLEERS
jgi:spore coat polysaccharide biosynthesis protein SpsF